MNTDRLLTASVFVTVTGPPNRMSVHLMIAELELSDGATSKLSVSARKHVSVNAQISKSTPES